MKILTTYSFNNIYKAPDKSTSETKSLPSIQSKSLPIISSNQYLVNFKGLTKDFKKHAYFNSDEVKSQAKKYPKSNGIIGNLPSEWIQKIPIENREKAIKNIYKSFKQASHLSNNAPQTLTKAFRNAGIIAKDEDITINYLNSGEYGQVLKIEGLNSKKEYVIKIFHHFNKKENNECHGQHVEINRAAFWQNTAGLNTERARFYFGDINAGYMVNEYIDKNRPVILKVTKTEPFGLRKYDEAATNIGHNKINGYAVDWGGFKVENKILAHNKNARYFYKKIFALPQKQRKTEFDKWATTKNDEIKIALFPSLNLLNAKDKLDYLSLFAKFPNQNLKLLIASENIGFYNKTAANDIFKSLSDGANDEVKTKLAQKLYYLSEENAYEYFKTFSQTSNINIKKELARSLKNIPANKRFEEFKELALTKNKELKTILARQTYILATPDVSKAFDILLKKASSKTKTALAENIDTLPYYKKFDYFNKLFKNSNKDTKIKLIQNICKMPEDKKTICFNILLENADTDLKSYLIFHLEDLPENDITTTFKTIAKTANDETKIQLINAIEDLPEKDRPECFKLFINDNDEVKAQLIQNLSNLKDSKSRIECFEALADNADEYTTERLLYELNLLPRDYRGKWFEKFSNNKDLWPELVHELQVLPQKDLLHWFPIFAKEGDSIVKKRLYDYLQMIPFDKQAEYRKYLD